MNPSHLPAWLALCFLASTNSGVALGAEMGFVANGPHLSLYNEPAMALQGITIERLPHLPGVAILHYGKELDAATRRALMAQGHLVKPRLYRLAESESSHSPDPDLWRQWHLSNPRGGDAEVFKGWSYLSHVLNFPLEQLPEVKVAVLDTGVDLQHPDLVNNLARNAGEIPGNGRDDDGNGYIDDVWGWNFPDRNNVPQDDNLHGTHVSGIVAATRNNGAGGSGVGPNAHIIPVRVFDASGSAPSTDLVRAIDYAVGRGARIINASWGGFGEDGLLEAAVKESTRQGVLFVAAAGNDGADVDLDRAFLPCGYTFPGVLCVGAVDREGRLASFSNYGSKSVDLFSQGVDIYSTLPGNQYGTRSGTSMAAPLVSGLAAALWGASPQKNAGQIKESLMQGAGAPQRLKSALEGKGVVPGIISLVSALGGDSVTNYDTEAPAAASDLQAESNAHFAVNLRWNCGSDDISVSHYAVSRDGVPLAQTPHCAFRDGTTEGGKTYTYGVRTVDWAGNTAGEITLTATTPQFGQPGAWSLFATPIESPHPYPRDTTLTWDIHLPQEYHISKLKIHFRRFDTEDGFDTLILQDAIGNEVATYSGERGEFLSAEIPGATAHLTLTSDRRNAKFGFIIDSVQALIE